MFRPGDKTDRFIHWPIRLAKEELNLNKEKVLF